MRTESSPADTPFSDPPIAFIGRAQDTAWLQALQQAMPSERIEADAAIRDDMAALVEIAIVTNPDAAVLNRYPNLKWIHAVWAGVEKLLPLVQARKLPLTRLKDPVLVETMREAVLAWVLYLHRDMPRYAVQQRAATWQPLPAVRACDRTIGVLGLGELGSVAASALVAQGFRVMGWSRTSKVVSGVDCHAGTRGLADVLAASDVVVVLLPSTAATYRLLNQEAIAGMKAGAALINFARGAIVDTEALLASLESGHLSHAVLDVFDTEPLPPASALWRHPQVTVLPHISAPTNHKSASAIVAANVARYRATGLLPAVVDIARGY